ncbi:plasmid mobilization protein [Phytohabitans aurantiacus]|uniref:Antitoxin n=1 Tax=Phytohabitans aurantiacus TaxID=3016789 RepID=A0ABQ5QPK8_9ACTN|nr:hypothetical protein [Phytohabitans aurantiacus]GLH95684.1 hypothetical protein Pa4123_09560 [Phytohabitans aurantiacus]
MSLVAERFDNGVRPSRVGAVMADAMTKRRVSVTLTEEAYEAAKRRAAKAGLSLSAWLAEAATKHARHQQAVENAEAAYEEAVRVNGPLSPEELRWVDEVFDATMDRRMPPPYPGTA